jgi:hypothetical protein
LVLHLPQHIQLLFRSTFTPSSFFSLIMWEWREFDVWF